MTDAAAAQAGDNGAGTPAPEAGQPIEQASWTTGFSEDLSAFVQNKGWTEPSAAIESYRQLERFAGGAKNLVEIPGDPDDAEAQAKFYNRIGRPETPDGYEMQLPEGANEELVGWFKNTSHELGLTNKQAANLLNSYHQMSMQQHEAMQVAAAEQAQKDIESLKQEWGKEFDQQIALGRRAARALGFDEQSLSDIENKLGTGDMLKLFTKLGSKLGEDSFKSGDSGDVGTFGNSAAQAQQKIASLQADKEFMQRYLSGEPAAKAKMNQLFAEAYPG